jgi:DNA-binding cell septation regulator SpoVG
MNLTVEWFEGKYPSFNLSLHSKEGSPAFLTIRGCRIVDGKDGPFVSYPAQKNEKTGKWWNHCQGSDRFNDEVLLLAKAKQPQSRDDNRGSQKSNKEDDFDESIPF